VEIAAVIGHSFGELTAMCVSGLLNLEDATKMIAGRARVIRDNWGTEKGAMIAVEADIGEVMSILSISNDMLSEEKPATVACFNGPKTFTLAGSV